MNAIETLRKNVISDLHETNTIKQVWPTWQLEISKVFNKDKVDAQDLKNLGGRLYDIFGSTRNGRDQAGVSAGGAAWEALVCIYLNLCLIGSNTVVIKSKKKHVPAVIFDSISVNYTNFNSNTESDLLAVTFPLGDYSSGNFEPKKLNQFLNKAIDNNFTETELCVIQCKTNWNDNAQIPMLWDLIYRSSGFGNSIFVGTNGYSHKNFKRFSYAFATVPTVKPENFKIKSTCVQRVKFLTGGNYWGRPSLSGVASNLFDMLQSQFKTSYSQYYNWRKDIEKEIEAMINRDNYFKL